MATVWSIRERRLIEEAMVERLEGALEPGEALTVEGESGPDSVRARFVLAGGTDKARLELEASVDPREAKLSPDDARDLVLDALDLILLEYLESERAIRFSGVEEARELRGVTLLVRAERTFPELEAQADALLKED